jgi:Holliday junction DNA helicase RuvB
VARRPETFEDFVGQRKAVSRIEKLIEGGMALGKACPSLLLVGPSGYGKTTLAEAIARRSGTELHLLLAGADTRAADVCQLLSAAEAGDIVFVDEVHRLSSDVQEAFFRPLEGSKTFKLEEGRLDRTKLVSVADFTLVAATDQPGRLLKAFRSRLTRIEFVRYTLRELKEIAQRAALAEGMTLTGQAARRLAEMSQGTPRGVGKLIDELKLNFPRQSEFGQNEVETLFARMDLDDRGLFPLQRLYLKTLAESSGWRSSLKRLGHALGCDPAFIEAELEPALFNQGLVEVVVARGRVLTPRGWEVIESSAEKPEEAVDTKAQTEVLAC